MADEESVLQVRHALDGATVARLREIFGASEEALPDLLAQLATAALSEYALAFTGTRNPSAMRELRELRLRLLFDHLPDGLPTDEQIERLFQMTPTQVSTLIAGTRARFDHEVGERLKRAAIVALTEHADRAGDDAIRLVVSDSLARYLRDLVARTSAMPMEKRKDASRTYDVGRDTVEALCGELGIAPSSVTAIDWP